MKFIPGERAGTARSPGMKCNYRMRSCAPRTVPYIDRMFKP